MLSDWISKYRKRGWKVVPIKKGMKHPVQKAWQTRDSIEVDDAPHIEGQGLGIQTGAISNLLVLDVDGEEGKASLRNLMDRYGPVPKGPVQISGRTDGGFHLLFQWPEDWPDRGGVTRGRAAPGIDIRGWHNQIVSAPTEHRSGATYTWQQLDIDVPMLPEWLKQLLHKGVTATVDQSNPVLRRISNILAKFDAEGENDGSSLKMSRARHACYLGVRNIEDFLTVIARWNEKRKEPWPDDKLVEAFEQAYGRFVAEGERVAFQYGSEVEVGRRVVDDLETLWPVVTDAQKLRRYEDDHGVWAEISDVELRNKIAEYDGWPCLTKNDTKPLALSHRAIKGAAACVLDSTTQDRYFESATPGFAFKNGYVTVDGSGATELNPHSMNNKALHHHSFDWIPNAPCSEFAKFMASLFAGDVDAKAKIKFLQEFIGICLLGKATDYSICVMLAGDGANGKSVFVDVMSSIFPDNGLAAVPPQALGHEYNRASLQGRLLNVVADIPSTDVIDSADFKAVISGDLCRGRHIYGSPFEFRPISGHLYSANALPGTRDQGHGFWRRFEIVGFNNRFERMGAEPRERLLARVLAEKPGIVSWAIDGAAAAIRRGRFAPPPSSTDIKNSWRMDSDQIQHWMEERCEHENDEAYYGQSKDLYSDYKDWAMANGHRNMNIVKFGRRLTNLHVDKLKKHGGNFYAINLKVSH